MSSDNDSGNGGEGQAGWLMALVVCRVALSVCSSASCVVGWFSSTRRSSSSSCSGWSRNQVVGRWNISQVVGKWSRNQVVGKWSISQVADRWSIGQVVGRWSIGEVVDRWSSGRSPLPPGGQRPLRSSIGTLGMTKYGRRSDNRGWCLN